MVLYFAHLANSITFHTFVNVWYDTKVIELKAVSKVYKNLRGSVHALQDISLTINQGNFVALRGSSGSGKSTLLAMLGGLLAPSHGHVLFNDQDVYRWSDTQLSAFRNTHIGFVFQDFLLLPQLTVEENIMLPGKFSSPQRTDVPVQLMEEVGMLPYRHRLPAELSGGQMQRVAIARALYMEPEVVLADEPTGNLDEQTGAEVIALFKKLHKHHKNTFIIATHDLEIAKVADQQITIKGGKLLTK